MDTFIEHQLKIIKTARMLTIAVFFISIVLISFWVAVYIVAKINS